MEVFYDSTYYNMKYKYNTRSSSFNFHVPSINTSAFNISSRTRVINESLNDYFALPKF